MALLLDAACMCSTGKVRKNNEDNFFFDGRCLPVENKALRHPVTLEEVSSKELILAVFDGMGGENFGEYASFAAAECMQNYCLSKRGFFIPERSYLNEMCRELNAAVVAKQQEFLTSRMGTTLVAFYFSQNYVYVCNVGDSRAYRFRDGMFQQLSEDHVEKREAKKSPLTQHLGLDPEECLIEPYIAKGELQSGDMYLLCSDGLTDMLTNLEITEILSRGLSVDSCVQTLTDAALERGGKDNITVIVIRVR